MSDLLRKPASWGIAIAVDRLVAVSDADRQGVWTHDLSACSAPGEWPDLVTALEQLRMTIGNGPAVASVALLPGLVQVRPIELPFMRKSELLPVLQRDAARFFFGVRDEHVVAVRHLHRDRGRRTVLAAAARRWLVELLAAELSSGALRLHQIVPAHVAWAFAASSSPAASGPSRRWLGVPCGDILELLELRRDAVRQIRRVRAVGDEVLVRDITGSLPPDVASVTKHDSAMAVAARYAGRARSLALVAPSVAAAELRQAWRQARWLISAAAVLLVTSSLLRVVDVNRELAHVRATRATMAGEVGQVLRARTNVSGIDRLVELLCEIRERTPRWSSTIVTVATNLPLDAHVLRLSSGGDSVTLEGATTRAADVLEQLRAAPGVMALHASAPIRVETNAGEDPTEYFAIVVRLAPAALRAGRQ